VFCHIFTAIQSSYVACIALMGLDRSLIRGSTLYLAE